MKTISLLLLVLLSSAAGAATQTGTYRDTCRSDSGNCPPPPVPPAPPAPPRPPAPPAPAIPAIPAIPSGAHAACAGKSAGTTITYVIGKGETMTGSCQSEGGKMLFMLRSYVLQD